MKKLKLKNVLIGMVVFTALAAVFQLSACKQRPDKKDKGANLEKFAIRFSVEGDGGSLKAEVDGAEINSGAEVEKGKTVIFTAKADSGFELERWTGASENPADKNKASLVVNGASEVKVRFKKITEPHKKFAISFSVEGNGGSLKAEVEGTEINSGTQVEEGKKVMFTATPNPNYTTERWINAEAEADDVNKAFLFVSKAVKVKVKFKSDTQEIPLPQYELSEINPPSVGISGKEAVYNLPGNEEWWKGIFVKNRIVKLSKYSMGKHEITYKHWYAVRVWAEKNGYSFINRGCEGSKGLEGEPPSSNEEYPVTCVSWRDCMVWCNAYTAMKNGNENECVYFKKDKASLLKDAAEKEDKDFVCDTAFADMSKNGFRLPTEAEWEFAARYQGDGSKEDHKVNGEEYGSGIWLTKLDSASGAKKPACFDGVEKESMTWEELRDELARVAVYGEWWDGENFDWLAQNPETTKAAAVKSKAANYFGLYDMTGNLLEWCFDKYSVVTAGTVTNPVIFDGNEGIVCRGGSWERSAEECPVGVRSKNAPHTKVKDLGFRVVCSIR